LSWQNKKKNPIQFKLIKFNWIRLKNWQNLTQPRPLISLLLTINLVETVKEVTSKTKIGKVA